MKRIFLFEDERGMSYYLKDILLGEGYDLVSCSSVMDIEINNARFSVFDLFLLDIMGSKEPEEGLIFAERLRQSGIKTPIVFSSSILVKPEVRSRVQAIDNSRLLTRPHSCQSLINEIRELLGE
jgi:DNA-binding response OmpR family regulator